MIDWRIVELRRNVTNRKKSFARMPSCYKHLQFYPERKCELGMGKTYTQFYRKWSEVKNKLY
jgi:hypothetical protein